MSNNPEPKYPPGPFTIGVGGVIISDSRALLVKLTYGHKGWIIPGGYVKSTETIGSAIRREVYEETGLNSTFTDHIYSKQGQSRKMRRLRGFLGESPRR